MFWIVCKIIITGFFKISFNDNLTATVTYNNNTEKEVTPTTISGYDMSVVDEQIVTVSYTEKEVTVSDTYSINVGQKTPVSLDISGEFSTNFYVGDAYSHDGLVATVTYDVTEPQERVVATINFNEKEITPEGKKVIERNKLKRTFISFTKKKSK